MTETINPLNPYILAVFGRKAQNVIAMDVKELTSYTDTIIVCSGRSNRQVTSIADNIKDELSKQNIKPLSVEGKKDGLWVLMDYGHVIIHIFYEETRGFYDIEGLWIDSKKFDMSPYENQQNNEDKNYE